jgi:glycosidase
MTTTPAATTRRHVPQPYVHLTNPEWLKDATLYQLHLWHFTPEGTLRAAAEHLPRLADLGVSVVWLSPIHEIGAKNRKGERGSPYAIKDHRSLDPGLGTMDDLRDFVRRATTWTCA